MNRAMILPAALAAGLHVALLGFRASPPASSSSTENPAPVDDPWVIEIKPEVPPKFEDPDLPLDLEKPLPPAPLITQGEERPTFTPEAQFTMIRPPTPEILGPPSTLIDPNWRPPSDSKGNGTPIYSVMELQNTPRALFRHSPTRPPGSGIERETVTVDFVVGKNGTVAQARIVDSSNASLEDACLRAVKRWRFEPGMRKNLPVAFRMQQTFVFTTRD